MGHLAGKEIFQQLGDKLDNLPFRISKNKELYSILKSLYTVDEAELIVKMPFGLSTVDQIGKTANFEKAKLAVVIMPEIMSRLSASAAAVVAIFFRE